MIRNDQLPAQHKFMQQDTIALQVSRGLPRGSCTVKGETADCIGLSLTLPKSYLATFKFASIHFNAHLGGERHCESEVLRARAQTAQSRGKGTILTMRLPCMP